MDNEKFSTNNGKKSRDVEKDKSASTSNYQLSTSKEQYRALCTIEESIPIFSRDWWLDIVCGENNWKVLLIEQKGKAVAAFPLYVPHKYVVSMPAYTQTMGPWFRPETDDTKYTTALGRRQNLCKIFIDSLKEYPYFHQNFSFQVTDWLPFYWEGYKQTTRYTYILENIRDSESLKENMSQHIRRQILKAKDKSGIILQKGIPVKDFLDVFIKTFERQGEKPKNLKTLELLINICQNRKQGDLWGGYDDKGRLHAAVFMAWQESSAYYIAGGGDPTLRDSGAHSYVMWECIQYAATKSKHFDFEGSMLPGVERFFREFGAIQTPYFAISKGDLPLIKRGWYKLKKGL